MLPLFKTNGLILRRQPVREADRWLAVLTPDHGKIELLARGASKIKSKLASGLEPFCFSQLQVAQGKNYLTVTYSRVLKRFKGFEASFRQKALADFVFETVDDLIKTHQSDPAGFQLVYQTLQVLEKLPIKTRRDFFSGYLIVASFIIKMLGHLGYRPELVHCERCSRAVQPSGSAFDFQRGSVVCAPCLKQIAKHRNLVSVTQTDLKLLRFILNEPFSRISRLKITERHLLQFKIIIDYFLKYYIETSLKSLRFINYLIRQKSSIGNALDK